MQYMWKMGKGWKHRGPLTTNGIHDNRGKNPESSKRFRQNEWNYFLQIIYCLSFFSLVLITPCPACSLHLFPMRAILKQCSLAQTESILTMSPKVNASIDPTHHLEMAVCEPAPDFWAVSWAMFIAVKLGEAGPFPVVSFRVMEQVQTSSSSFPKELMLHTPPVT